jgi:hypothetical protein
MAKRNYNCKNVELLTVSKTINNNLSTNLDELSTVRTTWTPEFVSGLDNEIEDAKVNFLGLNKRQELRSATEEVVAIQQPALNDLTFLKKQINADFGSEAKAIEIQLGYKSLFTDATNGSQESLIELLEAFTKGLTKDLRAKIVEKGTPEAMLDRIIGYTDNLFLANVTQENIKETSKELTAEAIEAFNSIYDKIINICKIASAYYKNDPIKRDQFTFKKVLNNIRLRRKKENKDNEKK